MPANDTRQVSVLAAGHYLGRPESRIETAQSTVVESTYVQGTRLATHAHARAHLCLVVEGGYEERLGRHSLIRQAGSVSFLPAGHEHGEYHQAAGRHLMVEAADAWLEELRLIARVPTAPVTMGRRPVTRLATRLSRELRDVDELTPLVVDALVVELLSELCRERNRAGTGGDWIAKVRDVLEAEPFEPHDLTGLGRIVDRHPVHVARSFRQHFGMSVGTYLRRRRVLWAVGRLRATGETVADVAAAAGFADQSHLAKWCRVFLGQSPSELRRR